jgi:hypothetical protein
MAGKTLRVIHRALLDFFGNFPGNFPGVGRNAQGIRNSNNHFMFVIID